jgi:hypothetical protein
VSYVAVNHVAYLKRECRTRAIIVTHQAELWRSWGKDDVRREIARRAAFNHLKMLLETSRLEPKELKVNALAALMNALVSPPQMAFCLLDLASS